MKHRLILVLPALMLGALAAGCHDDDHDRDWHHDHDRVVVHEEDHHAPDRVIVEEHHDHDR